MHYLHWRRLLPHVMRADCAVCNSYDYQQPLACPIHVFAGRQDIVPLSAITPWLHETSNSSAVEQFEGGHFYLHQQADALTARIEYHLASALHPTSRVHTP